MPRQPKKQQVVIPTTSLVASAVRYSGKSARIYQPNKDWQHECYRHYAICGEARFAAKFMGQALSRAELSVAKKAKDGPKKQTSGSAYETLADLFNGKDGQAQMLDALGTHLTIAGECYLVGRQEDGEDVWEIVSVVEMHVSGDRWTILYGDGAKPILLKDTDVIIRIWLPNPARRIEADSPFRSLLPVLSEIEWLTRHIFAQTQSRLTGAGILFLPQEMTFPPPPEVDGKPQKVNNEAEGFMLTLADGMLEPIKDPSSPAATVPITVTAPGEHIDKAKLMHFWSELDGKALEMRQAAISRFADGMDLPREQIMGMSSNAGTGGGRSNGVSHWGAWQIEESTIKFHIEPMLELICNALTIGYLRPLTEKTDEFVTYSTERLRLRPDRSRESLELYDRGLLKPEIPVEENGFKKDQMPDDEEFKFWLLKRIASGSATPEQVQAALSLIGIELPVQPAALPGPPGVPRETPPPPTLEDHPTRPRTPEDPGGSDSELPALLAASDALVWRALERAGNRIRQKAGVKPPGVPAYEIHTLYQCNGDAAEFLSDAWSCAPQVLDGIADVETTIQTLDSYCKALLHQQQPHTREALADWLTKVGA
jgi:hypothetical protein